MDLYEQLIDDHDRQRRMLNGLLGDSGRSLDRRKLFDEFRAVLKSHAEAEEQTLYATLIDYDTTQQVAHQSVGEHREALDLLESLAEMDLYDGSWLRGIHKLKDLLDRHMVEEEINVLPLADGVIDDQMADLLLRRYLELRDA